MYVCIWTSPSPRASHLPNPAWSPTYTKQSPKPSQANAARPNATPPTNPTTHPNPNAQTTTQVKADYDWGEARLDAIEQLTGTKELPLVYVGGQLIGGPESKLGPRFVF